MARGVISNASVQIKYLILSSDEASSPYLQSAWIEQGGLLPSLRSGMMTINVTK